jgi:transcriptional regulator with XRE-family HTH domain
MSHTVGRALTKAWLGVQEREGHRMPHAELASRVARRLGTAPHTDVTVGRWLRGTREPDLVTFFALCEELGLDPRDVVAAARAEAGTAARAQDAAVHARAVRAKKKGRLPPDGGRRGAASG